MATVCNCSFKTFFKMALVIVNLQLTVVYRTWRRLGCSPSPRTPSRSLHQGAGIAPTPGRSYKYTSSSVIITVTSSTRTSDLPVYSPIAAVYPHSNQPALHTLLMSYIPSIAAGHPPRIMSSPFHTHLQSTTALLIYYPLMCVYIQTCNSLVCCFMIKGPHTRALFILVVSKSRDRFDMRKVLIS